MGYEEDILLSMQAENLRRQNKRLKDFEPLTLETMGLFRNPLTNKVERKTDTATVDPYLARFKRDQGERLLGAYRSPQMEDALKIYRDRLPTGGTTGNQAKAYYDTNAAILREGINRGGLEAVSNLISQREGLLSNLAARETEKYGNVNASDLKLLSGIQSALQPYQMLKEQQLERDMQDAQNKATKKAGQYQLYGSVLTLAAAIIAS